MLIKEAQWLGETILSLPLKHGSVFLNFGSQSLEYNKNNSHILKYLIYPLKEKHLVKNLDLKPGNGIDFYGNVFEDVLFNKLKNENFDCILLCNVLEHVEQINSLCDRLSDLLKQSGIIIYSGPYDFPKHYDPIDNGFRPGVELVASLFPKFEILKCAVVKDYSYSYYVTRNFRILITTILRVLTPFYKYKKWKDVVLPTFRYWNRDFEITCVILQKKSQ